MKKLLFLLISILFFFGCSSKISNHFHENNYIRNFSIHITNDSLQLYFKSPADITYTTDKSELKNVIRQSKFKIKDDVLVHGKTNFPPYEYFVTISNVKKQTYPVNLVVYDTVIENKVIRFIGNPLAENSKKTLEIDLKNCFKSLELGPTYRKEISTVMDIVQKHKKSNKFYAVLNEITEFPTYDKQEEWMKFQMELTYSSFLGKNEFYENYLQKLESRFKPNDTIALIIKENVITNATVFETIINEAKKHKIVMINENHFYPNHRILVSNLLPKLKEIGYTYLALEALDTTQDSLLNTPNGYPVLDTGFYTSEQNYSNLIRKAKKLGFEFVAYENMDNEKNREMGQAENLYNKTFKNSPTCKVVVLAGIDHILEKPSTNGKQWMATIFKKKYAIDPLTISQTHLNSYRNLIKSQYGIIKSDWFKKESLTAVDFIVLNNDYTSAIENIPTTYPYKNSTDKTIQIALFFAKELDDDYDYLDKIPYFTTLVESGKKIELPVDEKEDVYLYAFDKNGKRIDKVVIKSTKNSL